MDDSPIAACRDAYSGWNTSHRGVETDELSGRQSMRSAMYPHRFITMAVPGKGGCRGPPAYRLGHLTERGPVHLVVQVLTVSPAFEVCDDEIGHPLQFSVLGSREVRCQKNIG